MPPPTLDLRLTVRNRPVGRQPVMYQKWRDLLFLHWTCSPEVIQRTLPEGLYVDTYEDQAYIGIIPFFVRGARPRFLPGVPPVSNFMELNVRTYAYDRHGVPGVWFYSLDAGPVGLPRQLVVTAARLTFFLPYFLAHMRGHMQAIKVAGRGKVNEIHYTCRRTGAPPELRSSFRYAPAGKVVRTALPGTLDFFLVERYILFSRNPRTGRLYRGQVHHRPYPLLEAGVTEWDTHMIAVNGLPCPDGGVASNSVASNSVARNSVASNAIASSQGGAPPAHVILSKGVNVKIYALQAIK